MSVGVNAGRGQDAPHSDALMLSCLAAYHVSRAIRPQSIYHEALHRGTAIEEDPYAAPAPAPPSRGTLRNE